MLPYNKANVPLARALRRDATVWERKLWRHYLATCPVRWQRQKPILDYIVDFYCDKAALVVELDGGGHYHPAKRLDDRFRTEALQHLGLHVLRYPNIDIDRHFEAVCADIARVTHQRM